MNRRTYNTLELTIVMLKDDVIRTSEIFTSGAPDVYEPDPFSED